MTAATTSWSSRSGPVVPLSRDELAALETPLRRFVLSHTGDADRTEDIVQETFVKTLAAAGTLEIGTLTGYAIAVARNEITSRARADTSARRNLPRMLGLLPPVSPEEAVTANESRAALAAALTALAPRTRRLLLEHDLHERPLADLAREEGVRAGTLAAQLHRTRARLRVDYVIALRRADLPTQRCRSVLLAISANDTRQQLALDAGEHLAGCAVCDALAIPLVTRDRTRAGFLPWLGLGTLPGSLQGTVLRHPLPSAAVGASTVAAAIAGVVLMTTPHHPPATRVPATSVTAAAPVVAATSAPPAPVPAPAVPHLSSAGRRVVPRVSQLGSAQTAPVVADGVVVLSVPGSEGFWVGDDRARLWVQMTGAGESPIRIEPGMHLDFRGTLVATTPAFVRDLALRQPTDRQDLQTSGVHVSVPTSAVEIAR